MSKNSVRHEKLNESSIYPGVDRKSEGREHYEINVPFTTSQEDIIELFQNIAVNMNFDLIESEETYATAIKKPDQKNLFSFLNCLVWFNHSNINAVKLTIQNSRNFEENVKICRVKALSEPTPEVISFIKTFGEKVESIKGTIPASYSFEDEIPLTTDRSRTETEEFNSLDSLNPFHLEASSYSIFHHIMVSSEGHSAKIREKLEKSLKDFFEAFKNIEESSGCLPTPLNNVMNILKEICNEIEKLLYSQNQSKESIEALMPFMKIAVEKFIFDRTETTLKAMYLFRDCKVTEKFEEKKEKILSQMSKEEIFEEVLLNQSFREIPSNTSMRGGIEFCSLACPELEKILLTSSPREKIKHCQLSYAILKAYFFEKMNKKYELNTMEDIIPVFIVLVLYTEMDNLRSELNIMLDYMHCSPEDFEAEKRLLTNLSVLVHLYRNHITIF